MDDSEKDRKSEFNPLRDIIIEKNRPVISNRLDGSGRGTRSVYMDLRILDGFAEYTRYTGESMAWCLEEALIEYMRNHPVKRATINITQDLQTYDHDVTDRLKVKIIKSRLEEALNIYRRVRDNQRISPARRNEVRENVLKQVDEAIKLGTAVDEELKNLLEEVENLL